MSQAVLATVTPLHRSFVESFRPRPACPLCGDAGRVSHYDRPVRGLPLNFSRCAGCTLIYQDPIPDLDALGEYFSSQEFISDGRHTDDLKETLGYYDYEAWDYSYRRTASLRQNVIARWAKPPCRLLEIGTATGSFLDEARKRGYETQGLDISRRFAEKAIALYGLNIENGFIEDHPLPESSFDVVAAFGGIACWWDPVRALDRIRRVLRPGGVFVFNFSDVSGVLARLSGLDYPEFNHASLVIYARRTMLRLLKTCGFEVLYDRTEWQYASSERIVTYWRSNLLRRVTDALRISKRLWIVPAVGTRLVVCRPLPKA